MHHLKEAEQQPDPVVMVREIGQSDEWAEWNISQNLTDRWGDINRHNEANKPLGMLENDAGLLERLRSQMWDELTFVVRKDGQYGILYEAEFCSQESEEHEKEHDPEWHAKLNPHTVVVKALVEGLQQLAAKFPGVQFSVPHESQICNDRPAAWAFVADGALTENNVKSLATPCSHSDKPAGGPAASINERREMSQQNENNSLSKEQAIGMLELQGQMNEKVNPDWIQAGYPFLRAVLVEGAEAIEHHGWKWWKAQEKDLAQLRMELIDIFHFTLSDLLIKTDGDIRHAAIKLIAGVESPDDYVDFDGIEYDVYAMDTVQKLELMMGLAVSRRVSLKLFGALLEDCDMTWRDLYRQYVGKNVLNFFRQDNGYKSGSYRKDWAGREDNEHLIEIMATLDDAATGFRDALYQALTARYVETA